MILILRCLVGRAPGPLVRKKKYKDDLLQNYYRKHSLRPPGL